jgi:hypothetical protein
LLLLVIVGTGILLKQLSTADLTFAREQATQIALKQAKEALIAYAATAKKSSGEDVPGRLPCPEDVGLIGLVTEGGQQSNCNTLPAIGRLPWRTLKLDKLLDGHGEPLWYAISPGFRGTTINSTTLGQLTVDAQPTAYAAIVFAPGPVLSGQARTAITAASPPVLADYLDGTNNNGDGVFTSINIATNNDRLLGITAAEITAPIIRRVLTEIRGADTALPVPLATTPTPPAYGLRRYYNDNGLTYPYADTNSDGFADGSATIGGLPYKDLTTVMEATANGWITTNEWFGLITYQTFTAPNRATLTLGSASLTVHPCTEHPCP